MYWYFLDELLLSFLFKPVCSVAVLPLNMWLFSNLMLYTRGYDTPAIWTAGTTLCQMLLIMLDFNDILT